jgi:hypothetical protein
MVATCSTSVPQGKVACTFHWSLVPREIKLRVWAVCEDELGPAAMFDAVMVAAKAAEAGDLRKK